MSKQKRLPKFLILVAALATSNVFAGTSVPQNGLDFGGLAYTTSAAMAMPSNMEPNL